MYSGKQSSCMLLEPMHVAHKHRTTMLCFPSPQPPAVSLLATSAQPSHHQRCGRSTGHRCSAGVVRGRWVNPSQVHTILDCLLTC